MRHHSDRNFAEAEGRPRFIEDREGREAGKGPLVCGGRAEGFFSWRAWIVEGESQAGAASVSQSGAWSTETAEII